MTRPIRAVKAKDIEKTSEAMINENKEQRHMQLEYLRKQQLQQFKSEMEEHRNIRLKDDSENYNDSKTKVEKKMLIAKLG